MRKYKSPYVWVFMRLVQSTLILLSFGVFLRHSSAQVIVYQNDFETNTIGTTSYGVTSPGFTPAGLLAAHSLTTVNLALLAPDGGPAKANLNTTTHWLGMQSGSSSLGLGLNVGKIVNPDANTGGNSPTPGFNTTYESDNEVVDLTLSGLARGATYSIRFDLLTGASWDGAATPGAYGPDYWYFSVNNSSTTNFLIDTIFSDVSNGSLGDTPGNVGAYSPQRYTDSSYSTPGPGTTGGFGVYSVASRPNPADVDRFTGADVYNNVSNGYGQLYGIYYFGHGAGNPDLTFTATGTTATLEWARYSGASDSSDEYWDVDNVAVSTFIGDANGDQKVDSTDQQILINNDGKAVTGGYADGDFNGDGLVNADDWAILQLGIAEYNAGNNQPLPEPLNVALPILIIASLRRHLNRNR